MSYFIDTIRRRSRNNGINFCRYWVVINRDTGEIVYDGDFNVNKKENKDKAEWFCQQLNVGRFETKTYLKSDGTKGEEIDWESVHNRKEA